MKIESLKTTPTYIRLAVTFKWEQFPFEVLFWIRNVGKTTNINTYLGYNTRPTSCWCWCKKLQFYCVVLFGNSKKKNSRYLLHLNRYRYINWSMEIGFWSMIQSPIQMVVVLNFCNVKHSAVDAINYILLLKNTSKPFDHRLFIHLLRFVPSFINFLLLKSKETFFLN